MKRLLQILLIAILALSFTSCQGAFMAVLDITTTIVGIIVIIIAVIVLIACFAGD